MRIDLNPSSMPELERSNGSANAGKTAETIAGANSSVADDVAQLSTGSDSVQLLKAQLGSVPELRQPRVDALRQAIADGRFKVSPQRTAAAMMSDSVRTPAKE